MSALAFVAGIVLGVVLARVKYRSRGPSPLARFDPMWRRMKEREDERR